MGKKFAEDLEERISHFERRLSWLENRTDGQERRILRQDDRMTRHDGRMTRHDERMTRHDDRMDWLKDCLMRELRSPSALREAGAAEAASPQLREPNAPTRPLAQLNATLIDTLACTRKAIESQRKVARKLERNERTRMQGFESIKNLLRELNRSERPGPPPA